MRKLALVLPLLAAACAAPATPRLVVIETREPAFTVFTPMPPDMTEVKLRQLIADRGATATTRVVSWDGLAKEVAPEEARVVQQRDFPGANLTAGIICLLTKAPGPWGITWNGGIALTRNDYDYARRTFASRTPSAPGSPVDPRGHLAPLGCL